MEIYKLLVFILILVLIEGTHAVLIGEIKRTKPELYKLFGRDYPGYYFFGLFWLYPSYRRYLLSGKLKAELSMHPKLLKLCILEELLWYAMWIVLILLVLL